MDVLLVIGRVLFSLLFVSSGFGHFQNREMMTGIAKSRGAPAAELTVPLTGAMIIVGGILVALGLWADLGALLIALFLIGTAFIIHAYWKLDDPQERAMDSVHFYKDVALLGAAIVIFYLYNQGQDLPASLTDALFGRW